MSNLNLFGVNSEHEPQAILNRMQEDRDLFGVNELESQAKRDYFIKDMNDHGYKIKSSEVIFDTQIELFLEMAKRITELESLNKTKGGSTNE